MKDGFVKVCAATPTIRVADCTYNAEKIIALARHNAYGGAKCIVFPELCITGYTCADLFLQNPLLMGANEALKKIVKESGKMDAIIIVGLPIMHNSRLYNVAAVICNGKVIGIVPKTHIASHSEFYEGRHFATAPEKNTWHKLSFQEEEVCFGKKQIFSCKEEPQLVIAVEICEDLWMPIPPSSYHAMAGANVIVNLSASNEVIGKMEYRRELVKNQSSRILGAYLYADAGEGESTTDLVFAGHNIIAENGLLLAEAKRFKNESVCSQIDVDRLCNERRRITTFPVNSNAELEGYINHEFHLNDVGEIILTRTFDKTPFVPKNKQEREVRCNEILSIQVAGLKKRLKHTHCNHVVIGLSGGLDSTLALIVAIRAFDELHLSREQVICITMPCFGTTNRTYENVLALAKEFGVTLKEISISKAVTSHLEDIKHDINEQDITYENAQARERTQILMDMANKTNGIVIGTGDMSELALGWATYNGDHMSMYGVNCSVPKTLVRFLVQYFAKLCDNKEYAKMPYKHVLYDILDTPVSPELLPPKDGKIEQKTEDIVGPYELHDFFLYYVIRFGFMPSKIFRLAVYAFKDEYEPKIIYKWLEIFYQRFFSAQFKRSCLPDGPKVGSVALSPRGDLRMPSDACVALWQENLAAIKI